jgi:hypothetical protein
MIPVEPSAQCAHARDILMDPHNDGFLDGDLTAILVDWLDLEAEVLACRTPVEDVVDWVPSVRLARWIMRKAGCDDTP